MEVMSSPYFSDIISYNFKTGSFHGYVLKESLFGDTICLGLFHIEPKPSMKRSQHILLKVRMNF